MSQRLLMLPVIPLLLVTIASPALAEDVDFDSQILPILEDRCYECHGADRQRGDLRLDSLQAMLKGGDEDVALVPGDAEGSNLFIRVNLPEDDIDIMPPRGDTLTDEQIALIKEWIDQGAEYGEGGPVIVPEAEAEALSELHQLGALAMPLARDTNLINVDFRAEADSIGDSQVQRLQGVAEQLTWLNLSNTRITDEGLRDFANFVNLTRLSLDNTGITDAGLEHLAELSSLEYLNLYNAESVTDAGLEHLKGLENLRRLYLWRTGVTEEGANNLQEALPELVIDRGWENRPPVEVTEITPEPINDTCPVSGEAVDPAFTVAVGEEGEQTVAFCCGNCKGQYEEDPEKFADAIADLLSD